MQYKENNDITNELARDFIYSNGQIFSSMNTEADTFSKSIFIENLEKNLGDPALFPGTVNIEKRVIKILGRLFQLPKSGTGRILSGGSEANITALWAIRNKNKDKIEQLNINEPEIIAPISAHASIDKAADILRLKTIKVPVTSQYQVNIKKLEKCINKNTIGVVGIAGTTAFGTIDPLTKINQICIDYGLNFHCDAAFGGLVFPFLPNFKEKYYISFDLSSLASITVDIHKMGRIPIPSGGLLWRDSTFPKSIEFILPYLPGKPKQSTITGTRSGASVIAFAKLWNKWGFNGFQKNLFDCIKNTEFLANELKNRGFLIPINPVINILGVKVPSDFSISAEKLNKKLWELGWTTSLVNGFLRFVIMPTNNVDKIKKLIEIIDKLIS